MKYLLSIEVHNLNAANQLDLFDSSSIHSLLTVGKHEQNQGVQSKLVKVRLEVCLRHRPIRNMATTN